jgi:hypothetical protein
MSIHDLFSKRQKKLRGEVPDVYSYDNIPNPLRGQIVHILNDSLGTEMEYRQGERFIPHNHEIDPCSAYSIIIKILCREYGVFRLIDNHLKRNDYEELIYFILNEVDIEKVLDAVELSFISIDHFSRDYTYLGRNNASEIADNAIEELNSRFQEHGIGYRYEEGKVIRIDSEFIHAEVVKPALLLLRSPGLEGAQAEFLKAHEHYRHGRTKESLNECLKSLESVMKYICTKRKWLFDEKATSNTLIYILFENELVPSFWSNHFNGLRATLEGGVPTARNRLGGHGQGTDVVTVPNYIAAYVIHQTASAVLFLLEADKAKT